MKVWKKVEGEKHWVLYCSSCNYTLSKDSTGPIGCEYCRRPTLFMAEGTSEEIDQFIESRLWP